MRRNFKGELVQLSEGDKKQLRALGFVFTGEEEVDEARRLQRRGSEPTPGKVVRSEGYVPSLQEQRPKKQGEKKGDSRAIGKPEGKKPVQRYPAIIIKGFKTEPGLADFAEIMRQLGVSDIKARMMQVKQQEKSYMLRVLLHEDDHVGQILKNKRLMRGTRYWIDRDLYARDWEEIVQEGKGKPGRRQQDRKEVEQAEDKRLEQLRRAPKTELFKAIHEGIEADARRQRRKSGNGQRGPRGWRQGEKRGSPQRSNWKTVSI